MTNIENIFITKCIKVESWPPNHRALWEQLFEQDDLFETKKHTLNWRPDTVKKVWKGYGAWLSYNIYCGIDIEPTTPSSLVTKERVEAYVEKLKSQEAAPLTVFCRVNELYLAIKNLAPNEDWNWLKRASGNLRRRAVNKKNKLPRLRSSDQLVQCGLSLIKEAEENKNFTLYKRALKFRDGLMIALLAYRPMRAKNFVNIKIDENLIKIRDLWLIQFSPSETKNRKYFEADFPIPLIRHLEKYLAEFRPFLLSLGENSGHKINEDPSKYLWISNEGRNLDIGSFTATIKKKTHEYFGEYTYPHLFRDAGVTTLIRHEPDSAVLTKSILGHNAIEITNLYYNQSKTIEASKKYNNLIKAVSGI